MASFMRHVVLPFSIALFSMSDASHRPRALSAIRHLSLSFRAGLALRPILDSTLRKHGTVAWKTADAQARLISETVLYRPSASPPHFTFGARRIAKFLRLLMHEIDLCEGAEWDEGLLELAEKYCQMRPSASETTEERVYFVFEMPSGVEVVVGVSEVFSQLGKRVWESGLVLRASLDNGCVRKMVQGKRILELGAGTGVSGGGYVDAGVELAMLTDVDQDVIENLRENVPEGRQICVGYLDMLDTEGVLRVVVEKNIDVVIVADLSYDPNLAQGQIRLFGMLFKETGLDFGIVALVERSENSRKVGEMLEEAGLNVRISVDEDLRGWRHHLVGWELDKVKMLRIGRIPAR